MAETKLPDKAVLLQMLEDGYTQSKIATMYGASRQAVFIALRYDAKASDIAKNRKEAVDMFSNGAKVTDIAEVMGKTASWVYTIVKKHKEALSL